MLIETCHHTIINALQNVKNLLMSVRILCIVSQMQNLFLLGFCSTTKKHCFMTEDFVKEIYKLCISLKATSRQLYSC